MNKKIVVAILLLCAALSMGCLEEKQTYVQEMNEKYEEPEFDLDVTRVYTNDRGRTTVVYSIENTGNISVTWLKVSVYLLDENNNVIATTLPGFPSGYSDYGLKSGQILYGERTFDMDESYGCASGGVQIVNYRI